MRCEAVNGTWVDFPKLSMGRSPGQGIRAVSLGNRRRSCGRYRWCGCWVVGAADGIGQGGDAVSLPAAVSS